MFLVGGPDVKKFSPSSFQFYLIYESDSTIKFISTKHKYMWSFFNISGLRFKSSINYIKNFF